MIQCDFCFVCYNEVGDDIMQQACGHFTCVLCGILRQEMQGKKCDMCAKMSSRVEGALLPRDHAGTQEEMFQLVAEGKLRPHVSASYPLAQGAQALNDMMNRKVVGKVVITS